MYWGVYLAVVIYIVLLAISISIAKKGVVVGGEEE